MEQEGLGDLLRQGLMAQWGTQLPMSPNVENRVPMAADPVLWKQQMLPQQAIRKPMTDAELDRMFANQSDPLPMEGRVATPLAASLGHGDVNLRRFGPSGFPNNPLNALETHLSWLGRNDPPWLLNRYETEPDPFAWVGNDQLR